MTDTGARLWVRTPGPASAQAVVSKVGGEESAKIESEAVKTTAGGDYVALLDIAGLAPLTSYQYDVLVDGQSVFGDACPGVLWTEHADKGGKDSWWAVKEEREEIFSLIDRERIGGVILLSADRYRTDVYKIERPDGYDLYEFETSKLTNNHTHPTKPKAIFSYNKGNYFGLLRFDLTKPDPEMTFECITINKESVYSLTLKRSQLQAE